MQTNNTNSNNKINTNITNEKLYCSINTKNIESLNLQNQQQFLKSKSIKQRTAASASLTTSPVKERLTKNNGIKNNDNFLRTSDNKIITSSSESISSTAKYFLSLLPTKLVSGKSVLSDGSVIQSIDEVEDLRKRTHSVGSKSWFVIILCNNLFKKILRIKPLQKTSIKLGTEFWARADSSCGDFFLGLSDCRRNSALFNNDEKPKLGDHVEIDFGIFICKFLNFFLKA